MSATPTDSAHSSDDGRPKRYIYSDADMVHFKASPAKKGLLNMVSTMGHACSSRTNSFQYDPSTPLSNLSPSMAVLHGALRNMVTWVEQIPSDSTIQARFGNPAFRSWHQRLTERSGSIVACILEANASSTLEECSERGFEAASGATLDSSLDNDEKKKIVVELQAYLHDSFGQPIRLDYGTGHETSFLVFLYALSNLGCFGDDETKKERPSLERIKSIAISVISGYLKVTRTVQTVYMLEPAGSHGVWGLDDYHCVPFYLGACQLIADHMSGDGGDDFSKPDCIHDNSALERDGDRFLYFGCIRYIKSLKKGVPFFESSPMLNDISNLSTWTKVSAGLLKLYEGEVLDKRPVVQHFVFGSLFSANWIASHAPPPPPTNGTFRTAAVADGGMPPTRAPWAK